MSVSLILLIIGVISIGIALLYEKPPVSLYKEWIIAIGVFIVMFSLGFVWLALGLFVIAIALFSEEPTITKYKTWLIALGIIIAIWPFIGTLLFIVLILVLIFAIWFIFFKVKK